MLEVLLLGLLIKVKNYLEALQFFTVTVLQAFIAREDWFIRQKEFFKITYIKKKNRKKRKEKLKKQWINQQLSRGLVLGFFMFSGSSCQRYLTIRIKQDSI